MTKVKELPLKFQSLQGIVDDLLGDYTANVEYELDNDASCLYATVHFFGDSYVDFRLDDKTNEWEMLEGHPDSNNWIKQSDKYVDWEKSFWFTAYVNK